MLSKIVILFLIVMAVMAMFGKLRMPRLPGRGLSLPGRRDCPACGAPRVGRGACPCGKGEA
jgi:hypothetical protein